MMISNKWTYRFDPILLRDGFGSQTVHQLERLLQSICSKWIQKELSCAFF